MTTVIELETKGIEVRASVFGIFFIIGVTSGIMVLVMWYLVYGAQGLISASNLGITIPFTSYTLHHELIGVLIVASGAPLASSDRLPIAAFGATLMGIGAAWLGDDALQHCFISQIQNGTFQGASCTNWP